MTVEKKIPIVGLAGGIGSGKSTIATIFNELGIQSVDADDVARDVVAVGSYCLNEIQKHFGKEILQQDGCLNRKALRDIIFKQPKEKLWLESLTHPIIRDNLQTRLAQSTSTYVLLVHPLLFETKQNTICRLTVAIDASSKTQRERVLVRDNVSSEQIDSIFASQLTNEERLKKADLIINNDNDINDLRNKVKKLHNQILELL
ncbi:Dephospho-CoA kinase [Marinomonas spartinae]|uniref:Dephospho-CoA kinase n=1 Tax=Marinomonas spartinae TaxID=1792290 RepID=A0A1A8TL27_9GAMM|nr:dephospho-CoA kinase [Marinomonas spartinae]SBS34563.1 Dephospho-CoA kinase [Marinomonas spartinae]SBS38171.1 Dephospho-CoA kinase [Marinomonas spartinae]